MRILEICEFSAGVCGVFTRVMSEAREFRKLGHSVKIFSSNVIKGTNKTTDVKEDIVEGVEIMRFDNNQDFFDRVLSKNVTYFNFEKALLNYKPDVVITHLIHPHSFKALKVCLSNNIPCYLVTHAPFNVRRGLHLRIATNIYYWIRVKPLIKKFTRIIAVTKWEYPYLENLGLDNKKVFYIPNGIPKEFFSQKKTGIKKDVLFLGRIASVKNIETLVLAAKLLPKINFSIVGPGEEDYLVKIRNLIEKLDNIKILPPVYNLNEKIKLIDEHRVFVLPSLREAMPQVLLEAMARGKVVISSDTDGGKEIIKNGVNGFLFKIGDSVKLGRLIETNIGGNSAIQRKAIEDSKKYGWEKLIKTYGEVLG